jgi:diguanylate cyclase (GGDEF)-like protein
MREQDATGKANAEIGVEIYADLVETLFGTTGSFLAGIFAGLLSPLIAWLSTKDMVYLGLVILMCCLAIYRIHVLVAHTRAPLVDRRRDARKWEIRYAIGGVSYMTAVGVTAAILFTNHHQEMIAYYGVILMTGCAGALASRNAGSPKIVFGQVIGTCTPLAVTALFNFNAWYWGLALILVFGMISVKSTTKFLHSNLEAALRHGHDASQQRKKFRLALDSMTHGLCMGDADMRITVVNRRVTEFFGFVAVSLPIKLDALAHAIGKNCGLVPAETEAFTTRWRLHAALASGNVFSQQIGDKIFDFHCKPANHGGFVTVIEDVTIQRQVARKIERIAHCDSLTGLSNRRQFHKRLETDIEHVARSGTQLALLNIDLDRFKEVNDTLGHSIGDALLCAVADRLVQCVRSNDMVARLGGDEFVLLPTATDDLAGTERIATRILDALGGPFVLEDHTIHIGASIGIAVAPRDATAGEDLLKLSDLALYRAKAAGRGKAVWFEPSMRDEHLKKHRIEAELRDALVAEQFVVHYQPIIDARDGRVVCCEALLRWRHPERGLISPADFIPIAEETGLIVEIGEWTLRQACRDALSWPSDVSVAVNFSPRQFQQKGLIEMIRATLEGAGLPPDRLDVEITETTLMHDTDEVARKLVELEAMGVRLSLDDFGTGYSSLGYLNRFPVKKVKIDRSFAKQLIDSPKTQAIVGAVALLARDLDIDVVAEGVETHAQLAALAAKNVFLIQGYLFCRPKPLEELTPSLGSWREETALDYAV